MINKKKFITFVYYHSTLFLMDRESHYQFGPCFAMLDAGYEVEMVSFWDSIRIENDPNYDPRIKITYKNSTFAALSYLWKNRDAIIYANTFILPSLLIGVIGKRTIFFSHSSVFPGPYAPYSILKKNIVKFFYHFFTKIRVINNHEIEWLTKEWLWNKWIYIPLVVSEKNKKTLISSEPNIILLWHVTDIKDPLTILRALSIIVKSYPLIHIYQIWSYEDYRVNTKTYKEIIYDLWIQKNITLLWRKKLSEVDVPTSIYINSSISEGQCIALYDAAIMWNAICAPNISSFLGVLDGNILYHDNWDYQKLANNIIWYIEHPEEQRKYINANQKWIHDHHNFESVQKRIQEEFTKI